MTEKPEAPSALISEALEPEAAVRPISREPITVSVGSSRWVAPLAAGIALIALGLATWALVRSPADGNAAIDSPGNPTANVCSAFQTVTKAVGLQTNTDLGAEPVAQQAVAGNARLALVGGGTYLLNRIPATTPPELAEAVRVFAMNLQDIGMNYLAGVANSDPAQISRLADGRKSSAAIGDLCR
jgi:hypothetical protein